MRKVSLAVLRFASKWHGGSITCNNESESQSLQQQSNRGKAALMYGFCRTSAMFSYHR